MRVARILRRVIEACRSVHSARLLALVAAVESLIRGGRLTLTGLGRSYDSGRTTPKHAIKRADRLVGNRRLWSERLIILRALAMYLVRGVVRPVVLIDWTGVGHEQWALVAAVPVAGRAIPILFEVHPQRRYGNRRVQERFLARLDQILPARSRPIIVADAGFRRPFYRAVDARGWGFVIRVRGSHMRLGPTRIPIRKWFAQATSFARELGSQVLCARDDCQFRAVLGAKPNSFGRRKTDYERDKAAEPWLLATNLWRHSPSEIVALYASRMKIEEAFRDTKSHRYGWAFDYARSRSTQRLETLLLIGALATFACIVAGLVADQLGITRRLQANTIRNRRVLSLFQVGRYVLTPIISFQLSTTITSIAAMLRAELNRISPSLPNGSWWNFPVVSLLL